MHWNLGHVQRENNEVGKCMKPMPVVGPTTFTNF